MKIALYTASAALMAMTGYLMYNNGAPPFTPLVTAVGVIGCTGCSIYAFLFGRFGT